MKTIKCYSTIGLLASIPRLSSPKLVRIACDKLENGERKVYVESGHSLGVIDACGVKIITQEQADELFDDDNIQEFRNFAALFNISI